MLCLFTDIRNKYRTSVCSNLPYHMPFSIHELALCDIDQHQSLSWQPRVHHMFNRDWWILHQLQIGTIFGISCGEYLYQSSISTIYQMIKITGSPALIFPEPRYINSRISFYQSNRSQWYCMLPRKMIYEYPCLRSITNFRGWLAKCCHIESLSDISKVMINFKISTNSTIMRSVILKLRWNL